MTKAFRSVWAVLLFWAFLALSGPAMAACSSPSGKAGDMLYNGTQHAYQYCNGTAWYGMGQLNPAGGSGTCSNPAGTERQVIYNGDYSVYQYCNGSVWMAMGGYAAPSTQVCRAPTPASGSAYFVLTKTTYTGNLGGLSGANAACLTELSTTNTGWLGYADANATGRLTSGKVKAFLCDSATCNNLQATTKYYFSSASDSGAGGASFTTDASGLGPNDSASWSAAAYFADSRFYWTNRDAGTSTAWSASPYVGGSLSCTDWSNSSSGAGAVGYGVTTNNNRWVQGAYGCAAAYPLICLVNP